METQSHKSEVMSTGSFVKVSGEHRCKMQLNSTLTQALVLCILRFSPEGSGNFFGISSLLFRTHPTELILWFVKSRELTDPQPCPAPLFLLSLAVQQKSC